MNAKKPAAVSMNAVLAGPQPLADEELGSVAGGHGHCKKHRTSRRRRTSWYRSTCGGRRNTDRYSKF